MKTGHFSFQNRPLGVETGQYRRIFENILRTENISCTLLPSPFAKRAKGAKEAGGFRAFRIPAIRSTSNECSTSSRRRTVHGQIEGS
jgi:hypothetical protein